MKSDSAPTSKLLFAIYAVLLALLIATVLIAEVNLGRWNFVAACVIAGLKAMLIMLYFMHLRNSTSLTRLAAVAGFCMLGIMFALTLGDFLSRGWLPD